MSEKNLGNFIIDSEFYPMEQVGAWVHITPMFAIFTLLFGVVFMASYHYASKKWGKIVDEYLVKGTMFLMALALVMAFVRLLIGGLS